MGGRATTRARSGRVQSGTRRIRRPCRPSRSRGAADRSLSSTLRSAFSKRASDLFHVAQVSRGHRDDQVVRAVVVQGEPIAVDTVKCDDGSQAQSLVAVDPGRRGSTRLTGVELPPCHGWSGRRLCRRRWYGAARRRNPAGRSRAPRTQGRQPGRRSSVDRPGSA